MSNVGAVHNGPRMGPFEGIASPKASFLRRVAALLLDSVIITAAIFAAALAIAVITGGESSSAIVIVQAFAQLSVLVYYALLEGRSGQTLGKKALGIRVIDVSSGGPIGVGRAVLRYLARILSSLPLFLGYLWMLWDPKGQTWHDKLASSVVVRD